MTAPADTMRTDQWRKRITTAMRADRIPTGRVGEFRVEKNDGCTVLMQGDRCWMADDDSELETHLDFIRRAHGRVLVTGLGLACVLRGLGAHGQCDSITVVEQSYDVACLVWPYAGVKVNLIHADATDPATALGRRFDYAWHDIWVGAGDVDPAAIFDVWRDAVDWQGAWRSDKVYVST